MKQTLPNSKMFFRLILLILMGFTLASAQKYIRYNEAGYIPGRTIPVLIMAESDLSGASWELRNPAGMVLQSGVLGASITGVGGDTPFPWNYEVSVDPLQAEGEYELEVDGETVPLKVSEDPYSVFLTQALRHLRVMRSGTEETLLHQVSHLGDSACPVYVPDGDPSQGAWKAETPERKVNMLGGWYDAGDYIKFTLTIAHTTYTLLRAWEENSGAFTKIYSKSDLPDLLDEARVGLDFLMKTFPDENTFIIQVSTGLDHDAGHRLPEADTRDGRREALSAVSRPHMGSTSAALALGARIFRSWAQQNGATGTDGSGAAVDYAELANSYESQAIAIMQRALQSDALQSGAFERDATNDFYNDETGDDNMLLGLAELYKTTGQESWNTEAANWLPGSAHEVSWTSWHFAANWAFKQNATAKTDVETEVGRYLSGAASNVWKRPTAYTWGSLHRWIGAANAAGLAAKYGQTANLGTDSSEARTLLEAMVDYMFGKNNWGVGMIASPDLPNSMQKLYSQVYSLLDEFPKGAVSEGPGEKSMHDDMMQYFSIPDDDPMHKFNTDAAVWFDSDKDFMIQEATTVGQGEAIFMLALALPQGIQAEPDSGSTFVKEQAFDISDSLMLDLENDLNWYLYDDRNETGGASVASDLSVASDSTTMNLHAIAGDLDGYQYAGVNVSFRGRDIEEYKGLRIRMNLPQGASLRINFPQRGITNYDYHGKTIVGRGLHTYRIDFADLSQELFGAAVAFDPSQVTAFDLLNEVAGSELNLKVVQVELIGDGDIWPEVSVLEEKSPVQQMFLEQRGDDLHVHLRGITGGDRLVLMDVTGKVIQEQSINSPGYIHGRPVIRMTFSLKSYAPGMYFVKTRSGLTGRVFLVR